MHDYYVWPVCLFPFFFFLFYSFQSISGTKLLYLLLYRSVTYLALVMPIWLDCSGSLSENSCKDNVCLNIDVS